MNDCKGHHKIEGYCDLCGEKCAVVADPTLQSKLHEAEAERDKAIKLHGDWTRKAIAQEQTIANQKALLDEIIANAQLVQATPNPDSGDAYLIDCEVIEKINKLQEVK